MKVPPELRDGLSANDVVKPCVHFCSRMLRCWGPQSMDQRSDQGLVRLGMHASPLGYLLSPWVCMLDDHTGTSKLWGTLGMRNDRLEGFWNLTAAIDWNGQVRRSKFSFWRGYIIWYNFRSYCPIFISSKETMYTNLVGLVLTCP